jgi:hypothetical protein
MGVNANALSVLCYGSFPIYIIYLSRMIFHGYVAHTICQYTESLGGVFEHYEAALDEYLYPVIMCPKMSTDISFATFTFLKLGRYDDCYNFIKWLETICVKSVNGLNYLKQPSESKEGDWIYPTGQDKMEYLDQPISTSCFMVNKTEKYFSSLAASQFCYSRSNKSTITLQCNTDFCDARFVIVAFKVALLLRCKVA